MIIMSLNVCAFRVAVNILFLCLHVGLSTYSLQDTSTFIYLQRHLPTCIYLEYSRIMLHIEKGVTCLPRLIL